MTLKIRSKRTHRSTETPRGSIHSFLVKTISVIDPITTKQSKRLKSETKYPWKPRLYIFRNISSVKSTTKNIFALSIKMKERREENERKYKHMFISASFGIFQNLKCWTGGSFHGRFKTWEYQYYHHSDGSIEIYHYHSCHY